MELHRGLTLSKRGRGAAVSAAAILLLTGCGGGEEGESPNQSSEATVTSSTSTSRTSSATTTSSSNTQADADRASPTSVMTAAPTLVECIYGGGAWTTQGWMSDGSYREHPTCAALRANQLAEYPYRCPQTDHHVADLADCAWPGETTGARDRPSSAASTSAPASATTAVELPSITTSASSVAASQTEAG